MKKGKQFKVKFYKFLAIGHSGFIYSIIGFITLSLIAFGSIIIDIVSYLTNAKNETEFIISIIVSGVYFIVSLSGTVKSIIAVKHNYFHRRFLKDEKHKDEIIKSVTAEENINKDYLADNYKWDNYEGHWYLYSEKVDDALIKRAKRLLLSVSPKKQSIGNEQRQALYRIVSDKIAEGKNIFNSNLVRLRTDLFIGKVLSDENDIDKINRKKEDKDVNPDDYEEYVTRFKDLSLVEVEKTDYFLNLTTNDQIYSQLFNFDYSSIYCGKDMSVDKYNSLYNLSQSPAANIIGVSTIAITKDGYLIINKQNNNNDINNDCFVPSGSGSSDFDDLKECLKIVDEKAEGGKISLLEEKIKSYGNDDGELNKQKDSILKFKTDKDEYSGKDIFDGYLNRYLKILRDKNDVNAIEQYIRRMKKYTCDFNNFITYGMVRELIEESHICECDKESKNKEDIKKYMKNTYVCGFIRILDRGGKPDFFGVTLLDLNKAEVETMFKKGRAKYAQTEISNECSVTDFNEVCAQKYVPLKSFVNFKDVESFKEYLNRDEVKKDKTKISLQIYYFFNRLKELFSDATILKEITGESELDYFAVLGKYFDKVISSNTQEKAT